MIKYVKTIFYVITGAYIFKQAPGSFIFSLRNKENLPPFTATLKQYYRLAINAEPAYGPSFLSDMKISDNAASNNDSYTKFGTNYQPPSLIRDRFNILAGTQNFSPHEVEVFDLTGEN